MIWEYIKNVGKENPFTIRDIYEYYDKKYSISMLRYRASRFCKFGVLKEVKYKKRTYFVKKYYDRLFRR